MMNEKKNTCELCSKTDNLRINNGYTIINHKNFDAKYNLRPFDAVYCPMCGRKLKNSDD